MVGLPPTIFMPPVIHMHIS